MFFLNCNPFFIRVWKLFPARTFLKAGLVKDNGQIIDKIKAPLGIVHNGDEFCKRMSELCFSLLENNQLSKDDIPYEGIGVPAAVSDQTDVIPQITHIAIDEFPITRDGGW